MRTVWDLLNTIAVASIFVSIGSAFAGRRGLSDALNLLAAVSYSAGAILAALLGWWAVAAVTAVLGAAWIWSMWRRSRKNRKRAPRSYGAKSRALVAALVRKARETVRLRPLLRPVPGGAR